MGSNFTGMNGTTVREGADITIGKIPGAAYGYKRDLRVTVSVRVERLERRETYETTAHETVREPLALSLTSNVWRPDGADIVAGGATVEPIREVAAHGTPAAGLTADDLAALATLGQRWHGNDFKAACEHQTVAWEDSAHGRRPSLTDTAPCPVTGYRYGTAWLVEPLPHDVLAQVDAIMSRASRDYVAPVVGNGMFGGGECAFVLDGVDTDRTLYYQCTEHDAVEVSPDAPCQNA